MSVDNKPALALLKPWEVTHFDVSGPLRVPSSRGNRYFSLFKLSAASEDQAPCPSQEKDMRSAGICH
jgi:hypothetical protein